MTLSINENEPLALSHRSPRTSPANNPILSLFDKIQSLKNQATNILETTTWPGKSAAVAQEFLNTIKDIPNLRNIPDSDALSSTNLHNDVQQVIKVLEDVRGGLERASLEYGAGRKGVSGSIKNAISWGAGRSSKILRSCRKDVEKAWTPLQHCLRKDSGATDFGPSSLIHQEIHPSSSEATPEVNPKHNPTCAEGIAAKQSGTTQDSIANPAPMDMSMSNPANQDDVEQSSQIPKNIDHPLFEATQGVESEDNSTGAEEPPTNQIGTMQNATASPTPRGMSTRSPGDQKEKLSVSAEVLNAAGKIFAAVDTVSGFIPIVGRYVGAAAKVGSAVVEMVQRMEGNEQMAKDFEKRASRLSDLIEYFKEQSVRTGGESVKARIDGLKSEITDLQKQVDEWKSTGKLKKALSATDDSDALNASVKAVENSLAEMQVLVSLNVTDLLEQLYTHNILSRLGDGDYGTQSKLSDNAACLAGTRVGILNRIDSWVMKVPTKERVLWIRGMAGRGKSTIARTVASRWKDRATCPTFHVRRGRDATNEQVVCALARQLALTPLTEVTSAILASVRENENVAHQSLKDQFHKLLIEPLRNLQYPSHPILLVVDALDEFQDTQYPVELIDLIHDCASTLPENVKFLLTSRPETTLLNTFREGWQTVDLDTVTDTDVDADIKLFVEDEFSAIKQKRGKKHHLSDTWPSAEDILEVVKMSQGLFQWARTAMAYIGERSPDLRLRELLKSPSRGGRLDDLYFGILSKALNAQNVHSERRELLSWVLGTLVVTPRPVTLEILTFLYADHVTFNGQKQDRLIDFLRDDILGDLPSLIYVPTSPTEPIRFLHTSIRDYLTDKEKSPRSAYEVDVLQDHRRLSDACLRLMGRDLRKNICDLSNPSKPISDTEIRTRIDLKVSQGLRHCCRVWSEHLTASRPSKEANARGTINIPSDFKPFSEKNILNWLEVMSLIGAMDEAWVIANNVWQWLLEYPGEMSYPSLVTLWDDTQRFIAVFHEPISYAVLHIYASAISHCPVQTKLWDHYGSFATVHVPKSLQTQEWPSGVWKKSIGSPVSSVAISPDGKMLASGCGDGTIRLWNAQTGSPLGEPLIGHSDWVRSIAFSPDGKKVASGSDDGTIRLLDAQTGSPFGEPLKGHRDYVTSVAFSPDGKALASGSGDREIRLWNAHTGSSLGEPLKGHSGQVWSVAFSPDGKALASGSADGTIRLWNPQNGLALGEPLEGHSSGIESVAFSPDSKTLASGSDDRTIRFWNAQIGSPLGEPLKGHSGQVWSVGFSPDGKALASGSADGTIRLWSVQTGSALGEPLKGHSSGVESVAFSPNGKMLASGSLDRTIRWWNAQAGSRLSEPLKGHSSSIWSIAFSPDGTTLASGSYDGKIQLWNAHTGSPLGEPLKGHSSGVVSVAFSSDSKTVVSRSHYGASQLWNVQTGEPLEGHSNKVESVALLPDGKLRTGIHQRSNIDFTSWPEIELSFQGQWLTLDDDRLLWLPDKYWRGVPVIAKLFKGKLAFVSDRFVSCFDVSGALGLADD